MIKPSEFQFRAAGAMANGLRAGSGRPLLYLHDAHSPIGWHPFMHKLAGQFEIFAPVHLGYGSSDRPDWLVRVDDLAYFYLEVLEQLNIDRAHIVASGLGGWIAMEMAIKSCARIATLTLAAPVGIRVKGVRQSDVFIDPPEQLCYKLFHDRSLADNMAKRWKELAPEELDAVYKARATTARLAWQPYFYNPALRNWLFRVRVPTRIIWGANDAIVPIDYGRNLQGLLPNASLETIDKCGHLPHIEKAAEFARSVSGFIKEAVQ